MITCSTFDKTVKSPEMFNIGLTKYTFPDIEDKTWIVNPYYKPKPFYNRKRKRMQKLAPGQLKSYTF